jgi:GH24 family phage-related lysozyme (muramidase)
VTDPRLIADLNNAEGRELTAYKDDLDNWTIGVGHLMDQSQDWTSYTITPFQSDTYLATDLMLTQAECVALLEWPALNTPCRQNAVLECVFNLGITHWKDEFPQTRRAIHLQDWEAAHDHLIASPLWIKEVGLGRVRRLAGYLRWGSYPGRTV